VELGLHIVRIHSGIVICLCDMRMDRDGDDGNGGVDGDDAFP
jgi:hypothetical protein